MRRPLGIWFFAAISALVGGALIQSFFSFMAAYPIHVWTELDRSVFTIVFAVGCGWVLSLFVAAAGLFWRQRWARPVLILGWAFPFLSQLWFLGQDQWTSFEPLMLLTGPPPVLAVWYFYFRQPVRAYYAALKQEARAPGA